MSATPSGSAPDADVVGLSEQPSSFPPSVGTSGVPDVAPPLDELDVAPPLDELDVAPLLLELDVAPLLLELDVAPSAPASSAPFSTRSPRAAPGPQPVTLDFTMIAPSPERIFPSAIALSVVVTACVLFGAATSTPSKAPTRLSPAFLL